MKLDGHAKITNEAISEFRSGCSKAAKGVFKEVVCKLSQFNRFELFWTEPEESNVIDNSFISYLIISQEIGDLTIGIGENTHTLSNGYLTRKVTSVDVEPSKLPAHWVDSLQKYHFMRPTKAASIAQAHKTNINFIRQEAETWLEIINLSLLPYVSNRRVKWHIIGRRRIAVSHLALALHSLQDSFSPGHTKRANYQNPEQPGPIEDIYIYQHLNKEWHSHRDYESGSIRSLLGRSAVLASANLIELCAKSAANRSDNLQEWDTFQKKWLKLSSKVK